jgi:hypothetical protein
MCDSHVPDRFRQPVWLILVNPQGLPCFNSTKFTGTRANLSQDHKCGCTRSPALTYIWTISTAADGMQSVPVYLFLYLHIFFASRHLHAHPYGQSFPVGQFLIFSILLHGVKIIRKTSLFTTFKLFKDRKTYE